MVPIRFLCALFRNFFVNWWPSARRFAFSLAVALAVLPAARAEKPKKEAKPAAANAEKPAADAKAKKDAKPGQDAKDAKPTDGEAEAPSQDEQITALMIPGQPVKGMRYAHRNEDNEVVMEFEAAVARKIDDENVEMENLKIIAFDEDGKKIDIDLPLSVFNVGTRILTGKDTITIKREDFEIVGATGEFNTKTRFAKFIGDVKMTILNTENLDQ